MIGCDAMTEITPALMLIGLSLIVVGIVVLFAAALGAKGETEAAVVGFVGPIPIGAGTSKEILYLAVGLTAALTVLFLLISRRVI